MQYDNVRQANANYYSSWYYDNLGGLNALSATVTTQTCEICTNTCPPGQRHSTGQFMASCNCQPWAPCLAGSYRVFPYGVDSDLGTTCVQCSGNRYSDGTGLCVACDSSSVSKVASSACSPCPFPSHLRAAGTDSSGNGYCACNYAGGYWGSSSSWSGTNLNTAECQKCSTQDCVGQPGAYRRECSTSADAACVVCAGHKYRGGGSFCGAGYEPSYACNGAKSFDATSKMSTLLNS